MRQRYWRRGADTGRARWPAWFALLGLLGSFAAGFLVLVPALEDELARTAESRGPAPPVDEAMPPVAPLEEPTSPASPAPEPVLESVPAAAPPPDYCHDAMVAALGNARIEFLSSSAEIIPASRNVVSVLAALAHTCPGRIVVDGHSDNLGPEIVNEQISLERAQAVVDAFIEFGIEPERLQARGFGSSQPIADNSSLEGRSRNRRIEMSLVEASPPENNGEQ